MLVMAWLLLLLIMALPLTGWVASTSAEIAQSSGQLIYLRAATLSPRARDFQVDLLVKAAPTQGRTWYLVQFSGPVQAAWKVRVTHLGGVVGDYLPVNTFMVGLPRSAVAAVARLPFVRWMGILPSRFRVSPSLGAAMYHPESSPRASVTVLVQSFAHALLSDAALRASGATVLSRASDPLVGETVLLRIAMSGVPVLAAIPDVAWIEPAPLFKQQSAAAPQVVSGDTVRQIADVSGVWTASGLYGAGQIVAIADTGLDTGVTTTINADFAGRIAAVQTLGRPGRWDDPEGHGTHVAGLLAGSGVNSGSNPAAHQYAGSLAGIAPEAHLVIQSILDSNGSIGGIPSDLGTLFQAAYDDGARIHNDSWGEIPQSSTGDLAPGAYDDSAQATDSFVWTHPDMLIVMAAGNDGVDAQPSDGVVDLGSINTPALAKDVIAVGASESYSPPHGGQGGFADQTWGGVALWSGGNQVQFPKEPIASSYIAANPNGMAPISSRGPTADGRIKPDLSAPAINVPTVHSSREDNKGSWGAVPGHPGYVYDGGTSMAAPIVAGVAALLREYLAPTMPSAALLKALLLNDAHEMAPGQYGVGPQQEMGPRPNNVEGWGRVDLGAVVTPLPPTHNSWIDASPGLSTTQTIAYTVVVTATSVPLHITLAWSDYPAATYAARTLVNDLDLTVRDPSGHLLYGNGVAGGDRVNTVETVDALLPGAGTYTIWVTGHDVPQGPQPYALAVTCGCNNDLASSAIPLPTPVATPQPSRTPLPIGTLATPTGVVATVTIHPTVARHLALPRQSILRRAAVTRSLRSWVEVLPPPLNQHRIVTRIIIQGHAHASVLLLIDLSYGPLLRMQRVLDAYGHLQVDVPSPSAPQKAATTVRRVRVTIGTGATARTYIYSGNR